MGLLDGFGISKRRALLDPCNRTGLGLHESPLVTSLLVTEPALHRPALNRESGRLRTTSKQGIPVKLLTAALAVSVLALSACSGANAISSPDTRAQQPSPNVQADATSSPSVEEPESTAEATAEATPAATHFEAPTPGALEGLEGQDAATEVAIADGSLGMTVDEFVARYNDRLDQGQYPITDKPEELGEQVLLVAPDDAGTTVILFVVNTDDTLRSITALSAASAEEGDIDRGMAQLEALVVWSTAAAAATPGLSQGRGEQHPRHDRTHRDAGFRDAVPDRRREWPPIPHHRG